MDQNSTNNILLRAYQEISINENLILDESLKSDSSLMDEFLQILELKNFLDSAYVEPNATSVAIIMEESSRAELETH